jgi:hypothetical protein
MHDQRNGPERCEACGGEATAEVCHHKVCGHCHDGIVACVDALILNPAAISDVMDAIELHVTTGWLAAHPESGLAARDVVDIAKTGNPVGDVPEQDR